MTCETWLKTFGFSDDSTKRTIRSKAREDSRQSARRSGTKNVWSFSNKIPVNAPRFNDRSCRLAGSWRGKWLKHLVQPLAQNTRRFGFWNQIQKDDVFYRLEPCACCDPLDLGYWFFPVFPELVSNCAMGLQLLEGQLQGGKWLNHIPSNFTIMTSFKELTGFSHCCLAKNCKTGWRLAWFSQWEFTDFVSSKSLLVVAARRRKALAWRWTRRLCFVRIFERHLANLGWPNNWLEKGILLPPKKYIYIYVYLYLDIYIYIGIHVYMYICI